MNYFHDFVKPARKLRPPTEVEREAMSELAGWLEAQPDSATPEAIQTRSV